MSSAVRQQRETFGSPNISASDRFKPLFEEMFHGSVNKMVDPTACIRFANVRVPLPSGVARFVFNFDSEQDKGNDILTSGYIVGSKMSVVVPLTGTLFSFVLNHFKETYQLDDSQARKAASVHDTWYGIVDGGYTNAAIRKLRETNPKWAGFMWFVCVLKGGFSVERYRQLARYQNYLQSPKYYVQWTLFDELYNLRKEFQNLCLQKAKPTHAEVAREYFGSKVHEINRSMTMLSSTAIRLSKDVINEIGLIMNDEHPDLCLKSNCEESCALTSSDAIRMMDCRKYRNVVRLMSLYSSRSFMNPKTPDEKRAQIHTLHRAKDLSRLNKFKTIQHTEITKQFQVACKSIKEEHKFLSYVGGEWPQGMKQVQYNLLNTTIFDEEIQSNSEKEGSGVLCSLKSALQSTNPGLFQECEDREKQQLNGDSSSGNQSNPSNKTSEEQNASRTDEETRLGGSTVENNLAPDPEMLRKAEERRKYEEDLIKLRSKGINAINKTWQDFLKSTWTDESERADLLISEPPPAPSRSPIHNTRTNSGISTEISLAEVQLVAKSFKRFVKPGGYVVLIMPFYSFMEWYSAIYDAGLDVMGFPFIFGYDSTSIQKRKTTKFPQCGYQVALVASVPCDRQKQFEPDFSSGLNAVNCSVERRMGMMFNIVNSKSKLCHKNSRVPILKAEQSVPMLAELMDIFSPHGGLVIDMFAGSLTSAIAALRCGRNIIAIEKDKACYDLAIERLRLHLPSTISILIRGRRDDFRSDARKEDSMNESVENHTHRNDSEENGSYSQTNDHCAHQDIADMGQEEQGVPSIETSTELHAEKSTDEQESALGIDSNSRQSISPPNSSLITEATLLMEIGNGHPSEAHIEAFSKDRGKEKTSANNTVHPEDGLTDSVASKFEDSPQTNREDDILNEHGKRTRAITIETPEISPSKFIRKIRENVFRPNVPWTSRRRVTSFNQAVSTKYSPGDEVCLVIDGEEVGVGMLLKNFQHENPNDLINNIHGYDLSQWEKPGQNLVAVTKLKIHQKATTKPNPYFFQIGQEDDQIL